MNEQRLARLPRPLAGAVGVIGLAVAVALMVAACGAGRGETTSSPLGVIDQATRTVQLNLILTGSNVNGYSSGQMTVRVPRGWRVDVYCSNQASGPHSCAITSGAGSTTPAFAGAASPDPVVGVPPGGAANFSFIVARLGSYRVASVIPGHRDPGPWEHFQVVAGGSPSVSTQLPAPTHRDGRDNQARRNS